MRRITFVLLWLLFVCGAFCDASGDQVDPAEKPREYLITLTVNPLEPVAHTLYSLLSNGNDVYTSIPFCVDLFPIRYVGLSGSYSLCIPLRADLPWYHVAEAGLSVRFYRSDTELAALFYYASALYHYEWGRKRMFFGDTPAIDVTKQTGYKAVGGVTAVFKSGFTFDGWGGVLIAGTSEWEALGSGYYLQTQTVRAIYGLEVGWSL